MTGDDLIVTAPWLVFGAGLAMIGYRLLAHRGTPPPTPGAADAPPPQRGGTSCRPEQTA